MGCKRIGLRKILLLTMALLWAFAGVICGCGSNDGRPASRQAEKPALSANSRVKEILPEGTVAQEQVLGRAETSVIEVFPPEESGAPGMTLAEVEAKAAADRLNNPQPTPVFPPDELGSAMNPEKVIATGTKKE